LLETLALRGDLFVADMEDAAANGGQHGGGVSVGRALESAAASSRRVNRRRPRHVAT
jgi:hypothetical protein